LTDEEFRKSVLACLKHPGKAFVIDDGLTVKAWPSHDAAVRVPDYFTGGSMLRVVIVIDDGKEIVLGAENIDGVRSILRAFGLTQEGRRVLCSVYDPTRGNWLNADGTLCREQDAGPQFRHVETRVQVADVAIV
jgi:hypothetical protein